MKRTLRGLVVVLAAWGLAAGVPAAADDYEIGGPLQGVKLPLFTTQHGEKPGYPGVIPELQVKDAKGNTTFTAEGLPPERQLYEGSVEHFRAYWFKYCPVKSFFDRQSLVKNWLAKDLAPPQVEQYAEPVYWVPRHSEPQATGKTNKPVPVVRAKAGAPVFTLDCGTLPAGMYAIRLIGAVEAKDLQRHRKPLILRLTVNDGLNGEVSTYRFRCKYVDQFYAMAEFYFHAPVKRAYKATLAVDAGSLVEPLVFNIDLHDALAGTVARPIKTRMTLNAPRPGGAVTPVANDAARLGRDADLWESFPPLNAQVGFTYGMGGDDPKSNWPNHGANGLTPEQIVAQHGELKTAPLSRDLLLNAKLNLKYSLADLAAGKPLPDPYPFKDNGTGVFTPAAKDGEPPQNWYPVANAVRDRIRGWLGPVDAGAKAFYAKGDAVAGRDAAVMLCRLAYDFPAFDSSNHLSSLLVQPGPYGRDMGCRRRDPHVSFFDVETLNLYDKLFDLIKADAGLAESVGRFIPWVKTPSDVIQLLDTYFAQTLAKRYIRYHYYYANESTKIVTPAICLADNKVTDPWLEWLFSSAFLYPLPPSGVQDLITTGNDRDGIGYIASYSYALGEQCAPKAAELEKYLTAGGNPKFDLRDTKRFPKPVAACYWYLESRFNGLYWPRIGDVAGPDKSYAAWFDGNAPQWRYGWRWTQDPKFAFVIRNFGTRGQETDQEWAAIDAAAAQVKRAPWLDQGSRMLSNWMGLLETGVSDDDFRFRRSVYLRVGQGWGHAHADTLDLQGHAHGYPFTIDGGQRNGYSGPADSTTRVHNLVEVDGRGWLGHAWVNTLSDTPGARYLCAEAFPARDQDAVKMYRRQVALVDVDAGAGSQPLTVEQLRAGTYPRDVTTPNSYVFDVVRVAGGKMHTYCFHGPVEDELVANTAGVVTGLDNIKDENEKAYLGKFPQEWYTSTAGTAPAVIEATWRMTRGPNAPNGRGFGQEQSMAQAIWNPDSPRKFTRLHVFGQEGARVLTGALHCRQWGYKFTNLFVQKRSDADAEVVFPALIEPYVGTPFITEKALLAIAGNETDARRAVAVQVKTHNGHTDLLFADGRPERTRKVGDAAFAGEFACVSTDVQGLRLATVTGGTLVQTAEVSLKPAARERTGTVATVDYGAKTMTLDQAWPAAPLLGGRTFEIGSPRRMTAYTVAKAKVEGKTTQVTVTGGANFYLSRVQMVDAAKKQVQCALAMPHTTKEDQRPCPGEDKHWVAANEELSKFWRADYLGLDPDTNYYIFQLDANVSDTDFGKAAGFCLLEYGVGDTVRQSSAVALQRLEPGVFELVTDVDLSVGIKGQAIETSTDRMTWQPAKATRVDGRAEIPVALKDCTPAGKLFLRVK